MCSKGKHVICKGKHMFFHPLTVAPIIQKIPVRFTGSPCELGDPRGAIGSYIQVCVSSPQLVSPGAGSSQVGCSYYRCIGDAVSPRVLLRDPIPMSEGKTALAEFEIMK